MAALYEMHSDRLRRMLRARLARSRGHPTNDELDDAMQEAFHRVVERRARGLAREGWANALGYLLTIARNAYIEHSRRRSRERALSLQLAAGGCTASDEEVDEGHRALQLRCLEAYLQALPRSTRAVYEARFVDGASQESAARRLGLSRRAVRTQEKRLLVGAGRWLRNLRHLTNVGTIAEPELGSGHRGASSIDATCSED